MSPKPRQASPKVTAEIAGEIKRLWKQTTLNQAQIAAKLGALNQGRVSEIINGQKFSDVPPTDIQKEDTSDQNKR